MTELKHKLGARAPKIAIILGSSLGAIAEAVENPLIIPYTELSRYPLPKISGHAGKLFKRRFGIRSMTKQRQTPCKGNTGQER